jgi:hypothetical protein
MAKDASAYSPQEAEAFDQEYSPQEIEASNQEIEQANAQLRSVGKTADDALEFFQPVEGAVEEGVDFFQAIEDGAVRAGWSPTQWNYALRLGCLIALRLPPDNVPTNRVTLGRWRATAGENLVRLEPAYLVGQKVARGQARKSAKRQIEAERCHEEYHKLRPELSHHQKCLLTAEKFFGDRGKYKTVERRLRQK